MKPGPATDPYKSNKAMSKQTDDDVISANCDVDVIFLIYGQFAAIWNTDSRCIVFKTYFFINSNLLSYKNWKLS